MREALLRRRSLRDPNDRKGVALFMVLAAVAMLSVMVGEFTYVAQINQKLAFDSLDQIQAMSMAKSAFKLSLLRLKAFEETRKYATKLGAQSVIPKKMLDQLWEMPFRYPLPTNLPGMNAEDRDRIAKFTASSAIEGSYTSFIESESSKFNLNQMLAGYTAAAASPGATPSPAPSASPSPNPSASPTPFDPVQARAAVTQYFDSIYTAKLQSDPDFQFEYRDFRIPEFMENVFAWADPAYQGRPSGDLKPKRAPFYSVTELHFLPGLDDRLYELFSPGLTVSTPPGVNINRVRDVMLRALLPTITDAEVKEFFKFRDDPETDNHFKDQAALEKWLAPNVGSFRNDAKEVTRWQQELQKKGVRIVFDESDFRIVARGEFNQSVRTIEAVVRVTAEPAPPGRAPPPPAGGGAPPPNPGATPKRASGLKLVFMRLL